MNSPDDHARALLARARDDLYVVQRLRGEPDAPGWVLGFHAQQAVEKALKAVMTGCSIEYPRTHNLVMLVEMLRRARVALPPDADTLGQLVPFGVLLRYEDIDDAAPPCIDPDEFEALVSRTIDWAAQNLKKEN
ncbi:MAG: HEPN domain-containing protein [Betaproteobacteria bacterium]|nr:HEPN domain-containing protein [Betaproteobacteria bacterium]